MAQEPSDRPRRCEVLIERDVHAMRTTLPGNVRQRVKRTIGDLATQPRPAAHILHSAAGCGDSLLPAQGIDDRRQGAQGRQQIPAPVPGQHRQGFGPEGVKDRARECRQTRDQSG